MGSRVSSVEERWRRASGLELGLGAKCAEARAVVVWAFAEGERRRRREERRVERGYWVQTLAERSIVLWIGDWGLGELVLRDEGLSAGVGSAKKVSRF